MADKLIPYIKGEDGSLIAVAVIYDKDGNDITETYLKKTDVTINLSRDDEGYLCVDES